MGAIMGCDCDKGRDKSAALRCVILTPMLARDVDAGCWRKILDSGRTRRRNALPPYAGYRLFHGHRLGEVARLIHVAAAPHRDVIGEQLHRDGG